jgi:hypothetical protein
MNKEEIRKRNKQERKKREENKEIKTKNEWKEILKRGGRNE